MSAPLADILTWFSYGFALGFTFNGLGFGFRHFFKLILSR